MANTTTEVLDAYKNHKPENNILELNLLKTTSSEKDEIKKLIAEYSKIKIFKAIS